MLEEKNRLLAAMQNDHELQMKKLSAELNKEREVLSNTKLKLQGFFCIYNILSSLLLLKLLV